MEPSAVPATQQAPKRCGGTLDGDKLWLEGQGAANPCSTLGLSLKVRDICWC